MSEPDEKALSALRRLFEGGADQAAQRLGQLSSSTWNLGSASAGPGAAQAFASAVAGEAEECWGSWLQVPGGGFLVVYPPKSARLVTNRFTSVAADAVDALDDREAKVLGEVSNIILNAMTDDMAAAGGGVLMLSSPEPLRGSKAQLLRAVSERFAPAAASAWTFHAHLGSRTLGSSCDIVVFLEPEVAGRLASGRKA